jgi:hypothetical protein
MNRLTTFVALGALVLGTLSFTTPLWLTAQDGAGGDLRRPLDLPSGGRGAEEEEEDAPETISFYGGEYEGDGFFWCLDRSCSMGWGGLLGILKAEMAEAISSLTENSEFSVVAFGDYTTVWSSVPKEATNAQRGMAMGFVNALTAEGATAMGPAGVQTVQIANMSDKTNKQILILSDGAPNNPGPTETLSMISSANWQGTPVNTVYIGGDSSGASFMQGLAAANGGTYSQP